MITTLELRNFKSFRRAELPLGAFTLVVGTNASGKSNLREALRFLHGLARGYRLGEVFGEKYGPGGDLVWNGIRGGLIEAGWKGAKELSVGVRATGAVGAYRYEAIAHISSELRYQMSEMIEVGGDEQRREQVLQAGGLPYLFEATLEESAPPLRFVFRPDQVAALRDLAGQCKTWHFFDLHPESMRRPSVPGPVPLGQRGENLSSVLHRLCEDPGNKANLLSWLHELTPCDVVDLDFPLDFTGRVLLRLIEADGARVTAASASDGTLRFLALAAALLTAENSLFFIEELDTGIHPTRLHLLVQLIERQCAARGVQVVATTHAPWMLSWLSEQSLASAVVVYRDRGDGSSQVRRIWDLPDIRRVLQQNDLAILHAEGWLEQAVLFADEQAVGR